MQPQPNILVLKSIFENKVAILKELKGYIKPIAEFAKEKALVYQAQEEEHLILEKHFFGEDVGLLPLVERLIELNGLLLSYEKPTDIGGLIIKHYDNMIELVNKEQYFLINFFRKTLKDVISHKGYKEYWNKSFDSFKSLINILRLDLTYFSLLLQTQAKTTVNFIINLLHQGKIADALNFLQYHESAKILSEEEIEFFKNLLKSIQDENIEDLNKALIKGKDLLEDEEFKLLEIVLKPIIENINRKITSTSVESEQLAENLVTEVQVLEQLKDIAQEIEAPHDIFEELVRESGRVSEIIDIIEGAVPEIQKNQKVTRFKKSKFRKLKVRFRIVKRKYKSKREALKEGLRVLKESANLRKRISGYLKSLRLNKFVDKLKKELNEIRQLLSEIDAKTNKFVKNSELVQQLNQLRNEIVSMLFDVASAIDIIKRPSETQIIAARRQKASIFSDLWDKLMGS